MKKPGEEALLRGVKNAVAALPGVLVNPPGELASPPGRRYDLFVTASVKGETVGLVIEVRNDGFPRDALYAAAQLDWVRHRSWPYPLVPLVAAPALTQPSRDLLREKGIGYWDAGGSLYLELPNAVYWIDRPPPGREARRVRNLFRGSSAQVLHALLANHERDWHVAELAKHAEVSLGTVHKALVALEERSWVESRGHGPQKVRVLTDPGAMLNAWADEHFLGDYVVEHFHRWERSTDELVQSIARACKEFDQDYALTLSSGAALVAPFLTDSSVVSILLPRSSSLGEIARHAKLKAVDEGANVSFLLTASRSPLMFRRQIGGLWVASDVQLFLDLWASPRRGKEQARHLRQERLQF